MNNEKDELEMINLDKNRFIKKNIVFHEEDLTNEDLYMMELHKKLSLMKNERKLVEKNNQILFNRLKLLKGEEEKVIFIK